MGPNPENGDVVDSRLRVYGVEGLRVCDASIFPFIISGHTVCFFFVGSCFGVDVFFFSSRLELAMLSRRNSLMISRLSMARLEGWKARFFSAWFGWTLRATAELME